MLFCYRMTFTAPAWINESFLASILQQNNDNERAEVIIKHFTTTSATAVGDNFLSTIVRVQVDYCCYVDREDDDDDDDGGTKQMSLIVKIPHHGDWIKSFIGECYKVEYTMYTDFLPKMYELLRTDRYFTPRLFYSNSTYTMVLEDLVAGGYIMPDKIKQLDYDHCEICLRALARFHAGSVAVLNRYPDFMEKVGVETFYTEEKREINKQNLALISEWFMNAVESWNLFENFRERTKRIWEEIIDLQIESYKPRQNSLNVLNHGDLWTNNTMFRYDSAGSPIDVKLIDFQTCRYSSPINDLCIIIFSSADGNAIETRLPDLMDAYLDALNRQLEEIGCEERLTKIQLENEFSSSLHIVFALIYEFLPFLYPDENTDLKFPSNATDSQGANLAELDIYRRGYIGKHYAPVAVRCLRFLERKGFF